MDNVNMNQMPPIVSEPPKKSLLPMIIAVVILAIIIIGGLYVLKSKVSQEIPVTETKDAVTDSLMAQSGADDLNSIEKDLNAETFDNLDQGASVIEAELQ
ncbi:MAG: hypothetical protein AAB392_03070 [Patescibacteria group bacterium]